jgi:predicted metallopeptidase
MALRVYSKEETLRNFSEALGVSPHYLLVIIPELIAEPKKTDVAISEMLMIARKTVGRCRVAYERLCESDMADLNAAVQTYPDSPKGAAR